MSGIGEVSTAPRRTATDIHLNWQIPDREIDAYFQLSSYIYQTFLNTRLFSAPPLSPRQRHIINPQYHLTRLGRELNSARTDKQGLKHILIHDVALHAARLDADTGILLAVLVTMTQVGNDLDAIQARVFGERRRDDLHRGGECFEADRFRAGE